VRELYTYLLSEQLPKRFPTIFQLSKDNSMCENLATGMSFPTLPEGNMDAALRVLGETVEEDLFLLQETPEGHRSVAFMCCFPSGFDPSSKLGKTLVEIHAPVPSYEKIGSSMEKFFTKLEVGKSVKRTNVRTLESQRAKLLLTSCSGPSKLIQSCSTARATT
jgi:hypothetical protein